MKPRREAEVMLEVVEQLCDEFDFGGRAEQAWDPAAVGGSAPLGGVLSAEDEHLIAAVKQALSRLAAVAGAGKENEAVADAVATALVGAELVMRGEIVRGRARMVHSLMPGFIFMVSLPLVDQDMALALSGRADELIERAFPS